MINACFKKIAAGGHAQKIKIITLISDLFLAHPPHIDMFNAIP